MDPVGSFEGSVEIFHGGIGSRSVCSTCITWHASLSTLRSTSSGLVDSHHDGIELGFKLFLLGLESVGLSFSVAVNPLETLVRGGLNGLLVLISEVSLELLVVESVSHLEAVVLKAVLSFNFLSDGIILSAELVGISHHLLNLLLSETTFIVGDCDVLSLASGLIASRHVENTVSIDIESDLDLRSTSWCRRNSFKVELSELMVILGHLTLSFEDLNEYTWLVIDSSGESLSFLGRNASVSWDEVGHDSTSSLDSLRERSDVKNDHVLNALSLLVVEDSSLNGSTVSNSLIRVDRSVELLSVEEVREHLLDLWNTSRTSNENDFVDLVLGDVSVRESLLDRRHALSELRHAELLKLGARNCLCEVLTLGKSFAVDFSGVSRRENTLCLLALS